MYKKTKNGSDPLASVDRSFEQYLNREFARDGDSKDHADVSDVRKTQPPVAIFRSLIGEEHEKNSRGKKSAGQLKE